MKRLVKLILIISSVAVLSSCGYNSGIEKQETVDKQWAQVENVYQRRMDLIPNLVNTVKGAANFEKSTLTAVMEARASATKVTVDPSKLTPEAIAKFESAQNGLSSALGKLMMVTENYPQLRANESFMALQAEIAGTENRIATERMRFNEVVSDYNTHIRKFPNNLFSGMFGFEKKGYFKANEKAATAPEVKF